MACLNISFLNDLLPSWLKRFVAVSNNSDQTSSSSRNTSLLEGNSSPVSHKSTVHLLTEYVPGITVLPSPPPIYLSTTSKSAVLGYQRYKPFSLNQTLPIPKERATNFDKTMKQLPALYKPPIFFSSTSGMHAAY